GLVSLGFQYFMEDVNPQLQRTLAQVVKGQPGETAASAPTLTQKVQASSFWQDRNFLNFLLYFSFWTFAVNLSSPFFNIYLLDNLALDVQWVTLYNSLTAAANLLMLVVWGRLSDRIGNRPLLLWVGILVALTPLLWLGVGTNSTSVWLWLPLLHIFAGSTWAAIELCSSNIQMVIAPISRHSSYFAIAAAVAGGSGALGTVVGGYLATVADYGGLTGMFALSSVVRLVALLPLIVVQERQSQLHAAASAPALGSPSTPYLEPLPERTQETMSCIVTDLQS
ncbi:MAG TPA: MFS transporter, partial [Candidatus Caenarcaniphilales bacterium]